MIPVRVTAAWTDRNPSGVTTLDVIGTASRTIGIMRRIYHWHFFCAKPLTKKRPGSLKKGRARYEKIRQLDGINLLFWIVLCPFFLHDRDDPDKAILGFP